MDTFTGSPCGSLQSAIDSWTKILWSPHSYGDVAQRRQKQRQQQRRRSALLGKRLRPPADGPAGSVLSWMIPQRLRPLMVRRWVLEMRRGAVAEMLRRETMRTQTEMMKTLWRGRLRTVERRRVKNSSWPGEDTGHTVTDTGVRSPSAQACMSCRTGMSSFWHVFQMFHFLPSRTDMFSLHRM